MEQGILLVVISLILIAIGGVILVIFSLSFLTSAGAAQFGGKCYFSFVSANLIDNFLFPAQDASNFFLAPFGIQNNFFSNATAQQIQGSCVQTSNLNGGDTTAFAEEIYSKAASCFNLFQGANAAWESKLVRGLNYMFECYSGTVFNSESPSSMSTYKKIINYINANYKNDGNTLQIVFLTNGSDDTANYSNVSGYLVNDSNYIIEYFQYPFVGASSRPQNCSISFSAQCRRVSGFDQPSVANCNPAGTPNPPEASDPVSSISTGYPFGSSSNDNKVGICGDYLIPFCGKLINTMIATQNRVFVCITKSTMI